MNIQKPDMHKRERLLHQTVGGSMLRVALEKDTQCIYLFIFIYSLFNVDL